VWLALAAMAAIGGIAIARHVGSYFFLFDDFALVALARSASLADIFTHPFIGFYRPLGFLVLWAGAQAFGWDTPAGYMGLLACIQILNSLLCYAFVRTLGVRPLTASLAGGLCLLSPWATEATFWLSGIFDVCATGAALATLLCVRLFVTGTSWKASTQTLLGASVACAALVAFFSKESSIMLPVLALLWSCVGQDGRLTITRRALVITSCVGVPAIVYLGVRGSVLGVLSGAYGSFGTLFAHADVPQNLWSYIRALIVPPLPSDWSLTTVSFRLLFVYPFLASVGPVLLLVGVMRRARLLLVCAVSIVVSLVPVLWVGLVAGSTVSTRFAYLPGVWYAMATALLLEALLEATLASVPASQRESSPESPPRSLPESLPAGASKGHRAAARSRWMAVAAAVIVCGYYAGSTVYQASLWRKAATISRLAMSQMETYRGRTDTAIHVTNLPAGSVEGPWILKAYAFRYYREGTGMPPVRADTLLMRLSGTPAPTMALGADSFADYQASEGRTEVAVTLRFPGSDDPAFKPRAKE
jgi:hypothetical protein